MVEEIEVLRSGWRCRAGDVRHGRFHQKGIVKQDRLLHSRGRGARENDPKGDVADGMRTTGTETGVQERVSVVIPAYNVASFLEETLRSVFAQTVQPFEVIVVNDGSPDTVALEAMLLPFRDRIVYLVQENQGPSAARNAGIAAARGDLIAFLDGDDLWMPEYLQTQTAYLRAHPEYDLVYCNAMFFGASIYAGKDYMTVCPSVGEADSAALIARRCHVFTSVTARTAALKAMRFDETLWSSEDFEYWVRLTAAGYRIGYHREVLVRYRKREASLSADTTSMVRANLKALEKTLMLWPKESTEGGLLREAIARKTAELETLRGKVALRAHDAAKAVEHLRRANEFYKSAKLRGVVALVAYVPGLVLGAVTLRERLVRSYRGTN